MTSTSPQDSYLVQIDTIWTLQDLTWELASIVARTQVAPEALYWGYVCHITALDADTETQHGRFRVHPSFLRSQMSIEPKLKSRDRREFLVNRRIELPLNAIDEGRPV